MTDTIRHAEETRIEIFALLRPHQWVKNAFVAAPLFFTPTAVSWPNIIHVLAGIAAFCAISSAVYVLNDYVDREADRAHPTKRNRPLAAGTVSVPVALAFMAALLLAGFTVALVLAPLFAAILLAYFVVNLAYSLHLKQVAILDVMLIAVGFVLRIEGGAILIDVTPSAWIIIMTGLLALFLALAKRRDDLIQSMSGGHRRSLDGYTIPFLDAANVIVTGSLLVAYLVFTTDQAQMDRLGTGKLFYTAPFVVFGILRYLQITMVEERSGSPTKIALTDKPIIATVLAWLLTFGLLIHVQP